MNELQRSIRRYLIICGTVTSIAAIAGFVAVFVQHDIPPGGSMLWGEMFGVSIWIDGLAWLFPALCKLGNERNNSGS